MSVEDRMSWSWLLLGLVLDVAVVSVISQILALGTSCSGISFSYLVYAPFLGCGLVFAHLVLMPIVLMPRDNPTPGSLGILLLGLVISAAGTGLGFISGLLIGIPTILVFTHIAYHLSIVAQISALLLSTSIGTFSGGATCSLFVVSFTVRQVGVEGPVTRRSALVGGGLAAIILFLGQKYFLRTHPPALLPHPGVLPLLMAALPAGLPHLLLLRLDLLRRQPALAPLRIAASRLAIVLLIIAAGAAILGVGGVGAPPSANEACSHHVPQHPAWSRSQY